MLRFSGWRPTEYACSGGQCQALARKTCNRSHRSKPARWLVNVKYWTSTRSSKPARWLHWLDRLPPLKTGNMVGPCQALARQTFTQSSAPVIWLVNVKHWTSTKSSKPTIWLVHVKAPRICRPDGRGTLRCSCSGPSLAQNEPKRLHSGVPNNSGSKTITQC